MTGTGRIVGITLLATWGLYGCTNPVGPSGQAGQGITMPKGLEAAYRLSGAVPPDGTTIVWGRLEGLSGQYRPSTRTVVVAEHLQGHDDRVLAGVLAHEIHHAWGSRHDCPDGVRDTGRHGAWEAQAITLDRLGVSHRIRETQFCTGA